MYFGQIQSQWSLNGTISYLCKLTIQHGRQGPLLKIMTISQEPLDEIDPALSQNVFCMKLFRFSNGTFSNLCKLTIQDGRQELLLNIA